MKVLGKKWKHHQMLKNKKDTSIKGKDSIGCDVDLNTTEMGSNETTIIERKVVDYFNVLTKHINNEDMKVIFSGILNDPSIKELFDFDGFNGNLTFVLVNNLRNSLVNMSRSEDDIVLKRFSLMVLLNIDVDDLNINVLSKVIGVSRKSVYNTMKQLILGGEVSKM